MPLDETAVANLSANPVETTMPEVADMAARDAIFGLGTINTRTDLKLGNSTTSRLSYTVCISPTSHSLVQCRHS